MLSGGGSNSGQNAQGSLIVDLILYGEAAAKKKGMSMTNSFHNTMSSSTGTVNQVFALKYILKNSPITAFEISNTNADGTKRTDTQMEVDESVKPKKGKKNEIKGGKTNAQKI